MENKHIVTERLVDLNNAVIAKLSNVKYIGEAISEGYVPPVECHGKSRNELLKKNINMDAAHICKDGIHEIVLIVDREAEYWCPKEEWKLIKLHAGTNPPPDRIDRTYIPGTVTPHDLMGIATCTSDDGYYVSMSGVYNTVNVN